MKPRKINKYFDENSTDSISYIDSFRGHKECIRVKATNVMYHPDFNSGNSDMPMPKSRARLAMSGRRYGNWNKEGNNGSGNYIDIEIYLATKKIAGEIGLTWNKEIANKQENDIAKALHALIKERITSKLNCDTSSPANKKLYELAIKNHIVVPEQRIPTPLRQEKKAVPAAAKKPTRKIQIEGVSDSEDDDNSVASISSSSVTRQPANEPNNIVTSAPSQTHSENIVLAVVEENRVIEPSNISSSTASTIVVEEEEEELVVEQEEKVEQQLTPSLSKAPEVIRKTFTISQCKETLENIKKHSNGINFDQEITKILFDYHDRCARDQIQRTLSFIPFKLKCDILMDFMNERYRYSNTESEKILCGSELFDIYQKLQE